MRHLLFSLICLICHPGLHAQTDSTQTAAFNALMTNASRQLRAASYDSCFISLSEAMRLADSGRKFGLMAKARSEMGVLHIYQGRYAMALANVQGALSIYERMGLTEGIAECHNNMGSIYYAQKEFEKARASYGKCLVIREQGKDRRALGIIYNNMGDVSLKLKDPSTALEYHRRSLAIWEELGSVSGKAITLELMGDCMDRMGDAEGALAMIKKGFATLKDSDNDARTRIIIGIKIGNLLNALGKAGEARSW
ncbi:MAG: tetratricopeptide repeat protein, partial [Flavobacteriales bacterium]|nr:tetratricopeptide repeat protein [Flavobacteriales bacterium]